MYYVYYRNSYSKFYSIPSYHSALAYIQFEKEYAQYLTSYIQNGAFPGLIIAMPDPGTDEGREIAQESIVRFHNGSPNSNKNMLLFTSGEVPFFALP